MRKDSLNEFSSIQPIDSAFNPGKDDTLIDIQENMMIPSGKASRIGEQILPGTADSLPSVSSRGSKIWEEPKINTGRSRPLDPATQ